MFAVELQLMKIRSVTSVAEFKGDGREHAQNVKVEWTTTNAVLAAFDPQLRSSFYQHDDGQPPMTSTGQEEIPMPQVDDKLTKLRVPLLQMPIKFKKDFAGYQMVYHCGASEQSEIRLEDVELSDFTFDMKEGGTVLVVFNAYAKPNAIDQGKIDQLLQLECEISLVPPDATRQKQLDLEGKGKRSRKKTAAEKAGGADDPFAGSDLAQGAEHGPQDGEEPPGDDGSGLDGEDEQD